MRAPRTIVCASVVSAAEVARARPTFGATAAATAAAPPSLKKFLRDTLDIGTLFDRPRTCSFARAGTYMRPRRFAKGAYLPSRKKRTRARAARSLHQAGICRGGSYQETS